MDVDGPHNPALVFPLLVVRVAVLVVPFVPNVKLSSPLMGPHPLFDQSRVACHLPCSSPIVMFSAALAEGAVCPIASRAADSADRSPLCADFD